jgi:hypothetical protein
MAMTVCTRDVAAMADSWDGTKRLIVYEYAVAATPYRNRTLAPLVGITRVQFFVKYSHKKITESIKLRANAN